VQADNGRFDTQIRRLSAGGANVTGRVLLARNHVLNGALDAQVDDVGRFASALEAFLGRPRGSVMPAQVEGALTVNANVGGTLQSPAVDVVTHAPALTVGGTPGVAINARASLNPSNLTIQAADLAWQKARINVNGRIGLDGARRLDLTASASEIGVIPVLAALDKQNVSASGVFNGQAVVSGTFAHPVVNATMHGTGLMAYEEPIGSVIAELNLKGSELVVPRFEIEKPQPGGNGSIAGQGSYHLDRRRYSLDLRSQQVRLIGLTLPGGQRIRGDVQLSASGAGTLELPNGHVSLVVSSVDADGLTPDTAQLGRIVIDGVVGNHQATVTAAADRFNLDARALVGVNRPWPAKLELHANDLDLAVLPLSLSAPIDGSFRMTLKATGDLAEPTRGAADLSIERLDATWAGQPFKIISPATLRYANEQLAIDQLELAAGDAALRVSGNLPLTEQAGTGEIAIDGRGHLASLAQYLPRDANITGDGVITISGSISGTLESIDPTLTIAVEDGLVLTPEIEPGLSNLTLRARVANGEAMIEQLNANWGSATVEASGRIPFDALPALPVEIPRNSGPSTFKAAVRGLNPAAIPGAPPGFGGRMALDAQVSAERTDLSALEGRFTFPELELSFDNLGLTQQQPTSIAVASGTATLETATLSGSAGTLSATGTVSLVGAKPLALDVDGTIDVGTLTTLSDAVQADGKGTVQLSARGTIDAPELNGFVELADVTVVSDEPSLAAEHLNARVDLRGELLTLTKLAADLNGGTLDGGGTVTVASSGVGNVDLKVSTRDVAFDAPLNLRSLSDADLTLRSRGDALIVGGQVTIDEAGLTGDFNFDQGLLAAMNAPPELNLTEQRNPLLERVQFEIDVDTRAPIVVDNNLARAEVAADVRVLGTPYEPGLTGRVTLLEGAEITLNERRFEAERGVITFVDERRVQPSVDLLLNTSAGSYDISVAVTGEPGETETTLTSDPRLPEPDIMALLVTGRTLDQMRGEEFEVAQEQALSYLTGRVGSTLGRGLERATGLSEVRIEPNLIANEADPSARLTIGQELTNDLNLVYSTSLTDGNDQIWVAEYDVTRRFQTRGVRQSDNSFRFDFSHDVGLGGVPPPRRQLRIRPTVTAVEVTNDSGGAEPELEKLLEVEAGDSYDFFTVRRSLQRIEEHLIEQGRLQSRVRLDRHVDGAEASLQVRVTPGPPVVIEYQGAAPPADIQATIRQQWHRGVFDKQRGEAGVETLRTWLMLDHYLQPSVEYRIDEHADRRRVVFTVQPGLRYDAVVLAFEGVSAVDPKRLDHLIETQHLEPQLFTDPEVVTELVRRYYREQGYLAARIDLPRYEFQGTAARVVVPIQEGPRFTVGTVTTSGNHALESAALLQLVSMSAGAPFLPALAERSLGNIRDAYWHRGYNSVRSNYALTLDEHAGRVDVAFRIAEGPQSVIADIAVEGNEKTSEHLVRDQIELQTSEPLDLALLARSRRNLYNTGAFSIVDVTRQELGGNVPVTAESTAAQAPEQVLVRVNVAVREVQPFQIRYGASYDTERGVGGILDVSNHNSLGKARVLGLQSRYDRQLREARLYISQPKLRYFPVRTTATLYFREELNPPTEITDAFDVSRKGVSIQQELELRDKYIWAYGYRYERAQTLQPSQPPTLAPPITVSPLTTALTRDTRDEVLDATTGNFLSQAFAFSPSWLGSDLPFLKYYGQHFYYFPLRPPREEPLSREPERPRWVFATGVRVGLAYGIGGGEVPASERFYAGGSTTLRGFAQNAVGPIGEDRVPTGGNALLVLNNELRVPLVSIVDGVAFADIGNVFAKVSNVSFTDLRESAGIGLRLRTPWFLLRGDYGFVLDHRPGERRSRFYFSIGQAF
jgi:outer membrane protein insertion porin family